jgi:hypothetical protein
MLRYRDIPTHTTELLDLTSLTVDEFAELVPPFEAAFLAYMAAWTLHGRRRQRRRYATYINCPLPTPEDQLLFILAYSKQHPTHLLHGRLFGMRQSKATQWIHGLLPVWQNALRTLGDAPCRSVETLRRPRGGEAALRPVASAPSETVPTATPAAAPLFVMTAPNDPSRAPQTRLNRKRVSVPPTLRAGSIKMKQNRSPADPLLQWYPCSAGSLSSLARPTLPRTGGTYGQKRPEEQARSRAHAHYPS